MGSTKTHIFTEGELKVSEYAKAFSHPARVAIIHYLLKNKSCICKDLTDEMPLSQSTISQHLKELKQIGIIKGEIISPKTYYSINEEIWNDVRKTLFEFVPELSENKTL